MVKSRIFVLMFMIIQSPFALLAEWPTSPDSPINVGWAMNNFEAVSDMQGGAYVVMGIGTIYCTRLNAQGNLPWSPQILDISGNEAWLSSIATSSDSGLLVAYNDIEFIDFPDFVNAQVRVQKFDTDGNKLWGTGVIITPPNASGTMERALPTGIIGTLDGGVYVVWGDCRDCELSQKLYVQRLSAEGDILWDEYGVYVAEFLRQIKFKFTTQSNDLTIVYSTRPPEGVELHLIQSFSEVGSEYYEIGGIDMPSQVGYYYSTDNQENLFYVYGYRNIVRLSTADLPALNFYNTFLNTPGETFLKGLHPDQSGGVFIPLYDVGIDSNIIYYQWLDSNGVFIFDEPGIYVRDVPFNLRVNSVKSGENFISIIDGPDHRGYKVNPFGGFEWEDVLIYDNSVTHYPGPIVISDNSGGAIYLFEDDFIVWATKVSAEGVLGGTSTIDNKPPVIPYQIVIESYPNPFNPSTTIKYELPERSNVTLSIYDINGRNVQTLVSEPQLAGHYDTHWNGTNTDGKQVSAGMYFAKLQAGEWSSVVKMVYLR